MEDIEEIINFTQKLKLLYVEDNQEARESTRLVLDEFFSDIVVAINGEDGYEKFQENNIDLIITDINMPKLNGLEMVKKITGINKNVSILVLSAYNESGFFMESIKLGVDGYLLKPIDMDQFMGALNKVVQNLKLENKMKNQMQLLNQYQEATDNSSIVSKTDTKGIITYVNDEFTKISGYSKEELIGKSHNIIRHPDNPTSIFEDIWKTIKDKKQIWKGVVRNQAKNGKSYYVNATIKPILDIDNNILEYIALRDDITDIMNPKKQLNDAITNAKNPVVIYMKISDFSTLEEFYDNTTVEKLQDKITICLEELLPENYNFEKIYQLGNGEYALLGEEEVHLKDKELFFEQLKKYQELVQNSIVDIGSIQYDLSIIISIAYDDNRVLESAKLGIRELVKTKQDFIIANEFSKKEHEKAQKNIETISMIKKALNEFKIISHFQPIINNKTEQIEKYESLVRLVDEDEDGKILSPFFFLDVAKKGKYYSDITSMVLSNSFSALSNTTMDISINLSALDIELKSTRKKIFELLEQHKEHCSRIVIELLEDESVKEFKTITSFINRVKQMGVKIAIDDFGAGYSNFERMLDYQPDILKIDACLIRDIETNNYSKSVVKTIVAFAKEQGIKTVAEYVENEAIYNIIKEIGVDYSQGYYFGKPDELK